MSSTIPTRHTDGDAAVGRNATVGGNATVRGNARIGHNLLVEGWLEARNVKGSCKGVFRTEAQLREAYPAPENGWWAIVGDALPGPLYVGWQGAWKATGKTGGVMTGEMTAWEKDIEDAVSAAAAADEKATAAAAEANQANRRIDTLRYVESLERTYVRDGAEQGIRIDCIRKSGAGGSEKTVGPLIPLADDKTEGLMRSGHVMQLQALLDSMQTVYTATYLSIPKDPVLSETSVSIPFAWGSLATPDTDKSISIPAATSTTAGVMTAEQARQLAGLTNGQTEAGERLTRLEVEMTEAKTVTENLGKEPIVTGIAPTSGIAGNGYRLVLTRTTANGGYASTSSAIIPLADTEQAGLMTAEQARQLAGLTVDAAGQDERISALEQAVADGVGNQELMTHDEGVELALDVLGKRGDDTLPPGLTEDDFMTKTEVENMVDSIFG